MSEEQTKEVIERIGYQEFYRYYQEKDILIEQQKQEIKKLKVIVQVVLQKKNLEELDIDKLYEVALKLKEEQMIDWK